MRDSELSADVKAKLVAFASQHNESLEAALNHVLRDYFSEKEEEDRHWREALAADADMDRGQAIEGEKIIAWLKSWGTDSELPPP